MIHGHGDDVYRYNGRINLNFSSNVCTCIDHKELEVHLVKSFPLINSYPEPDGKSLATAIANKAGVIEDEIVVTNGATEAIYLIANTFKYSISAIISPTFEEYSDACSLFNHKIRNIKSLNEVSDTDDIIWLCNPNNPNGLVIEKDALEVFMKKNPNKILVMDLSYNCFSQMDLPSLKEICRYPNMISIHSLTKKFSIPGLRIGYLAANSKLTGLVKKCRMPWSVNTLALEAGKYLIELREPPFDIIKLLAETFRFRTELNNLNGITAYPTSTHFFLCKTLFGTAGELKQYLIETHSILIRDASNFWGLDQRYFRISTRDKEENDKLINAIKEWTEHYM